MSQILTLSPLDTDLASVAPKVEYSTSTAVPTTSALAAQLGLLEEEFAFESDLEVTLPRKDLTATADLQRDGFWIRDANLVQAMRDRAAGHDSRLVALSFLESSHPVITRASSGIRSLADLKGKRLGIVTNWDKLLDLRSAQQLKIYTTALSTAGLTPRDVKFVSFERDETGDSPLRDRDVRTKAALEAGKDIAQRLERDEFDAVAVDSASDVAHHASIRILYDTLQHPDYLARAHPDTLLGVVVSGRLLRERRDVVIRALARLLQAADWARAHPKDAANELAQTFDIGADSLTGKYENLSEGLQLNLGVEKILSLKAQKNFLLRHGLLGKDFDTDPWVDHGPLVEAHLLLAEWKSAGRRK